MNLREMKLYVHMVELKNKHEFFRNIFLKLCFNENFFIWYSIATTKYADESFFKNILVLFKTSKYHHKQTDKQLFIVLLFFLGKFPPTR